MCVSMWSLAAIMAIFSSSHGPGRKDPEEGADQVSAKCHWNSLSTAQLLWVQNGFWHGLFFPSSSLNMHFGWQPAKKAAYFFFTRLWISAIWKRQPCIYFGVMVDHGRLKRKIYTFWDWPVRSRFTIPPPLPHKTTKSWNLLINWGHFWGR